MWTLMARVLLVAIHYAPELTGGAVNNMSMVALLREKGHSVEVVTGVPHYPQWRIPPPYRLAFRRTELLGGVPVNRFRHFVPRRQTALTRGLYELTFALNAAFYRPRIRPDVVLGVVPSLGAAVLARLYAGRSKAPWGVVFSDLMGRAAADAGMPGGRFVAGIVSRLELSTARAATGVAVIADGFRPYLEGGGVSSSNIYRIVNLNRVQPNSASIDRAATRRSLGWGPDEIVVLHSGNMGYKQALENIIAAAALSSPDDRYRFVLMGDGNCRDALLRRQRRLRLTNLEFRELTPTSSYASVLEAADVLVLNQRASVRDMSVPGKISNYLAAGTPVVAAVAPDSESARELEGSEAAVLIPPEDPRALLDAIHSIVGRPDARESLTKNTRAYAASRVDSAATLNVAAFVERLLRAGAKII